MDNIGDTQVDDMKEMMCDSTFRKEEDNRYYVALSLAEAETVRKIMHTRANQLIEGSDVGVCCVCQWGNGLVAVTKTLGQLHTSTV